MNDATMCQLNPGQNVAVENTPGEVTWLIIGSRGHAAPQCLLPATSSCKPRNKWKLLLYTLKWWNKQVIHFFVNECVAVDTRIADIIIVTCIFKTSKMKGAS